MTLWLRATDCSFLKTEAEADPLALRLVQRLLELALSKQGSGELAGVLLEEIASALRADQAAICEAMPEWQVRWHHARRGARPLGDQLPRSLLSEVLDREAGVSQPPTGNRTWTGSPACITTARCCWPA